VTIVQYYPQTIKYIVQPFNITNRRSIILYNDQYFAILLTVYGYTMCTFVPVHDMTTYGDSRSIVSLGLKFGSKWHYMGRLAPRTYYQR